jgi:DNA polymerase-1
MQNIPRSGSLRSFIRAPEGRVFVIADYSQIELRIAAKISGDTEMLSAYAEGRDLHTLTAQSLTGHEKAEKMAGSWPRRSTSACSTEWELEGFSLTP